MEAIARRPSSAVGPPLKTLEAKIVKEIRLGDKAGYIHYRRAGEALHLARPRFDTASDFWDWAVPKFNRSDDTLRGYMLYAQEVRKSEPATLSEVVAPNRDSHQPAWQKPVQNIMSGINPEAIARQAKDAKKEAEMVRALGYKLIDIGFKALATKLHPDVGGSKEAMARLNHVKQILRGAL